MMGTAVWIIATAAAVAFTAPVNDTSSQQQRGASDPWRPHADDIARFREVVEDNIFRPQRTAAAQGASMEPNTPSGEINGPAPPGTADPSADPHAAMVLVGVSEHDDVTIAFIEDRVGGGATRVPGGGKYAGGVVRQVLPDGIVYEVDGQTRRLVVGQTLLGTAPVTPAPATADGASSQTPDELSSLPSTSPPTGGSSSTDEILRRLRERRNQESNNRPGDP